MPKGYQIECFHTFTTRPYKGLLFYKIHLLLMSVKSQIVDKIGQMQIPFVMRIYLRQVSRPSLIYNGLVGGLTLLRLLINIFKYLTKHNTKKICVGVSLPPNRNTAWDKLENQRKVFARPKLIYQTTDRRKVNHQWLVSP